MTAIAILMLATPFRTGTACPSQTHPATRPPIHGRHTHINNQGKRPTDAIPNAGGLSAKQLGRLSAAHVTVIVPTYLPPHMHFWHLRVKPKTAKEEASYEITYRGSRSAELTIFGASEGIGDLVFYPDKPFGKKLFSTKTLENPDLGELQVELLNAPSDHDFGINWVDLGASRSPRYVAVVGRNIPYNVATSIASGLRFYRQAN